MVVLDQRRLPEEEVELWCITAAEVADAIRTLAVRGAPAIGVAAAYGLALAAQRGEDLDDAYDVLASSRPTAVNLRWALDELRDDPTPERARALHEEEVERCRRMARACRRARVGAGSTRCSRTATRARWRRAATGRRSARFATAWEAGLVEHVWVDETRPLLQGARLTAWELDALGIPFSVIVDSAAPSLMAAGEVDAVFTGADRIAANGDVANKVGTYGLAVAAAHHAIPFQVVAPTSTLDPERRDGRRHPDRGARSARGLDALPGTEPGVRRHSRGADLCDRDRGRSAPSAVLFVPPDARSQRADDRRRSARSPLCSSASGSTSRSSRSCEPASSRASSRPSRTSSEARSSLRARAT